MTDLRQRLETWIDEAAHPEFSAFQLHKLANEIHVSTLLTDLAKVELQSRIALKFEQRYGNSFGEEACGWRKVMA